MKKLLSVVLALTMIFALTACGAPAAADPGPDSEPSSDAVETTPGPSTVEGVVKEVSPDKIIITLADGSSLALTTSGIAGLEVEPGDTVKAEYTGEIGSLTASKVEVTAKAEREVTTVSGVVTKVDDEYVYLTLEDGTEAALHTVSMEEGEVEEGDTLTIRYADGGGTILSIDVTKAEKETGTGIPAAATAPETTQTVPAASSQAPVSQAPTSQVPAPGSQVISGNADFYYFAVAASVDGDSVTFKKQDGTRTTIRYAEAFAVNMSDRKFQVGDDVVLGYRGTRDQAQLMYIMLNTAKQPGTVVSLDDDDDYYYDDDEEDYTPSSKPSTGSSSGGSSKANDPPENAGDVYEAIRLINIERKNAGLKELEIDSELMEMAQVRAEELVTKYEHTRPDGRNYLSILDDFGWDSKRYNTAENINVSRTSATKTVETWMDSPGHKANILKENVTRIGVGCGSNYRWAMLVTS